MKARTWLAALAAGALLMALSSCGGRSTADHANASNPSVSDSAAEAPAPVEPESYRLRFTRPFPDVDLVDLEGAKISTRSLLKQRDTIVLIVSTSCEACAATIETWKKSMDQIPSDIGVFGVVAEEPDFASRWAKAEAIPFPLYCDPEDVFFHRFHVESYPTVVGVDPEGTILYALHGVPDPFLPWQAVKLLEHGKKELRKRRQQENADHG